MGQNIPFPTVPVPAIPDIPVPAVPNTTPTPPPSKTGRNMGLHPLIAKGWGGLSFRWMFSVQPYFGESVSMLPPNKAARPNISFKEYQAEHLHETIYFPGKVEWQTIEVSLYDIKCNDNPIYEWLKWLYCPDPENDYYVPALALNPGSTQFKNLAQLNMFDGCGNVIESWAYMNAYPLKMDWGEVEMNNSSLLTVNLTLRYDRAYIVNFGNRPKNFRYPKQS